MDALTSKDNKKIKYFKSLQLKKNRTANQEYLVEGLHLCEMAQEAGVLKEVILTEAATFYHDTMTYVSSDIIKHLSDTQTPQPIIGLVTMQEKDFDDSNYIVLDNLQEPGNLGAILRSALAFGYKNVILSEFCVDIYNPKVLRSAQGAVYKLNIQRKVLVDYLPTLEAYKVATMLDDKATVLSDFTKPDNTIAIIVGNEGKGISKAVANLADEKVYIPIQEIDSLNVVVAASIVMEGVR